MKNKYEVGDLITDKINLYMVMSVNDEEYHLKVIAGQVQGTTHPIKKNKVENIAVIYDINNPLTKVVNDGVCHCEYCGKELAKGDSCVRCDDRVYCDEECMFQDLDVEEDNIEEYDLDNSKTKTVPMFELTKEQLDMMNEKNTEDK